MESFTGSTDTEMPRYQCHKKVWGLKIKKLVRHKDGSGNFVPEEELYAPIKLAKDYIEKHHPKKGGYYVVYEGGYKSYSPADAFEDGYSKI